MGDVVGRVGPGERLKVHVAELLRRLRVQHARIPLEAPVVEACKLVDGALRAVEADDALESTAQALVERQGRRMLDLEARNRKLEASLAEACEQEAGLAKERDELQVEREALMAELARLRSPDDFVEVSPERFAARRSKPRVEGARPPRGGAGAEPPVTESAA